MVLNPVYVKIALGGNEVLNLKTISFFTEKDVQFPSLKDVVESICGQYLAAGPQRKLLIRRRSLSLFPSHRKPLQFANDAYL